MPMLARGVYRRRALRPPARRRRRVFAPAGVLIPALVAGTASFVGSGTAGISVSATAPTGGSGSGPTYQWERNASGGSYSDLSGATSLSLTDATASAGTLYGYRCKQTRGTDTVTTNAVTAQVYSGGAIAGGGGIFANSMNGGLL